MAVVEPSIHSYLAGDIDREVLHCMFVGRSSKGIDELWFFVVVLVSRKSSWDVGHILRLPVGFWVGKKFELWEDYRFQLDV